MILVIMRNESSRWTQWEGEQKRARERERERGREAEDGKGSRRPERKSVWKCLMQRRRRARVIIQSEDLG